MFKELLTKSITGFFFGLGVSIAVISAVMISDNYKHKYKSWFGAGAIHFENKPVPGLVISSYKQRKDTENFTVVGLVKNTAELSFKDIFVKIEIYDGEFILGTCSGSVSGGQYLNKDETGHFSIDCRDMKTSENNYPFRISISYAIGLK
jgi:hypothetical protein